MQEAEIRALIRRQREYFRTGATLPVNARPDAVDIINRGQRPLALYVFTQCF